MRLARRLLHLWRYVCLMAAAGGAAISGGCRPRCLMAAAGGAATSGGCRPRCLMAAAGGAAISGGCRPRCLMAAAGGAAISGGCRPRCLMAAAGGAATSAAADRAASWRLRALPSVFRPDSLARATITAAHWYGDEMLRLPPLLYGAAEPGLAICRRCPQARQHFPPPALRGS
eukprot:XP_001702273.1 predicted protein [Chlamydomonas reinhardtii]